MLDKELQNQLIATGRSFMKGYGAGHDYDDFESDQELKLPQPPLCKAPVTPKETHIALTRDFSHLKLKNDLVSLIRDRKSSRVYTQENMCLDELAFLLWATQGVKSIRGKAYATIRTVPCGGARHEFETYLAVRKVDGLKPGFYHYLPLEHTLELISESESLEALSSNINDSLCGQSWAGKSNVVFYWSMVAYRAEWRYGVFAHRVALIDAGHLGQNLYLACTGLGLGTCGIGAFQHDLCNEYLHIDGEDEYVVYTAPVGTIRAEDKTSEDEFYKFVEEQGL